MGNMCCGSPGLEKDQGATPEISRKTIERIATDTRGQRKEEVTAGNEFWRDLHLDNELVVRLIHPHALQKTIVNAANARLPKSVDDKPKNDDDDSYDDEDDDKWLCEGTVKFVDGCKSGQKTDEFDLYLGTERWSCPDRKCDFDLCEMCTRWCLHCERNDGITVGWVAEDP